MTDIVERLETTEIGSTILCREAASEIMRLRLRNECLVDTIVAMVRYFSTADPEVAMEPYSLDGR